MEVPKIGTFWVHKVQKHLFITIVQPSSHECSRKNIAYKYHHTGHIGGCNSSQWFYSEWDKIDMV
jgi:hypothetical protein